MAAGGNEQGPSSNCLTKNSLDPFQNVNVNGGRNFDLIVFGHVGKFGHIIHLMLTATIVSISQGFQKSVSQ